MSVKSLLSLTACEVLENYKCDKGTLPDDVVPELTKAKKDNRMKNAMKSAVEYTSERWGNIFEMRVEKGSEKSVKIGLNAFFRDKLFFYGYRYTTLMFGIWSKEKKESDVQPFKDAGIQKMLLDQLRDEMKKKGIKLMIDHCVSKKKGKAKKITSVTLVKFDPSKQKKKTV